MKKIVVAFFFLLFAFSLCADEVIYLSPNGNDSHSGKTPEEALKTPAAAVAKAIEYRAGEVDGALVIELAQGTYELRSPLVLTEAISGTESSPTIFRAAQGAKPIISGGREIRGFTVGDDGYWRVTLDEVQKGEWYFQQLFVNHQRRYRPRFPKNGDYIIAGQGADPIDPNKRFQFSDNEISANWKNLGDVEICSFQNWTMGRSRIEKVDEQAKVVSVNDPDPRTGQWNTFIVGNRYFIENLFEALSDPGEFYLDRKSGVLTYIPLEGETLENTTVIAPVAENLITISGSSEKRVQNLQFQGLTFAFSNWETPLIGNMSHQAEVSLTAAIPIQGAEKIDFIGCGFRNLGNAGIFYGTACKGGKVEQCAFKDIGGSAIRIGGDLYLTGNWPYEQHLNESLFSLTKEERLTERIQVTDSTFHFIGRLHPAAIGIWIGHAAYNRIERCEVSDIYYSAISIGWIWGYGESLANHNTVQYNDLNNIGQWLLSDMGAVYTLGISPGTKVSHNLIHNVKSFDYGGWGLYTDEGSTDVEMSHNIVYDTKSGLFHQHYGCDNRIEYNIFADSIKQQAQYSRIEDHNSFYFDHNVFYWTNDSPLYNAGAWRQGQAVVDQNIFWNPKIAMDQATVFDGLTFEEWKEESDRDHHSIIADPLFTDPENGDFSFPPQSPLTKMGFSQPEEYGPRDRPTILDGTPDPPQFFFLPVGGKDVFK